MTGGLRNLPEFHLVLVESRDREDATLRVIADVGGRAHRRYNFAHLAVAERVDRRIGPAGDEHAAVAGDLDAVILTRTVGELRDSLARRPRLHVLSAKGPQQKAIVVRVQRD